MRPGIWQIVIIVLVIAVLFGAKKIPELARSLGKAKGEFKKGLVEGEKEEAADADAEADKAAEPVKEIA
jgi:sec-independent protein translocase protein TatA